MASYSSLLRSPFMDPCTHVQRKLVFWNPETSCKSQRELQIESLLFILVFGIAGAGLVTGMALVSKQDFRQQFLRVFDVDYFYRPDIFGVWLWAITPLTYIVYTSILCSFVLALKWRIKPSAPCLMTLAGLNVITFLNLILWAESGLFESFSVIGTATYVYFFHVWMDIWIAVLIHSGVAVLGFSPLAWDSWKLVQYNKSSFLVLLLCLESVALDWIFSISVCRYAY